MTDMKPHLPLRPGPTIPAEEDHYGLAHQELPTWFERRNLSPAQLWGALEQGDWPGLPAGWTLLLGEASARLDEDLHREATLSGRRSIVVSLLTEPKPALVVRFPEPTFATGVRWACWAEDGPGEYSYSMLEAGVTPDSWVLGFWDHGRHQNMGIVDSSSFNDFHKELELVQSFSVKRVVGGGGRNPKPFSPPGPAAVDLPREEQQRVWRASEAWAKARRHACQVLEDRVRFSFSETPSDPPRFDAVLTFDPAAGGCLVLSIDCGGDRTIAPHLLAELWRRLKILCCFPTELETLASAPHGVVEIRLVSRLLEPVQADETQLTNFLADGCAMAETFQHRLKELPTH